MTLQVRQSKAVDGPISHDPDRMSAPRETLGLGLAALDRLMPMHLTVSMDGRILRVGPTLRKLRPEANLLGRAFFEVFELRRPRELSAVEDLLAADGGRLSLAFAGEARGQFKGLAVPLPQDGGALINLSFGISVVDAVRAYDLSSGDFAATELAVEMLYLVEAKSVALHESKKLNLRLQGAKVAAEEQAYTDTLTGLKNRRAADHVLGRFATDGIPFGLMQLDLDFFKQVNDTHGHAAGDEVLQSVAKVLVSETRDKDTVARVGGDEFVLLFQGLVDVERLEAIAKRIICRLEEPILYHDNTCRISGSIGITTSEIRPGADVEAIIQDADNALYASKHAGRGCCTISSGDAC